MSLQTALIAFVAIVLLAIVATRLRPREQTKDGAIVEAINLAISKEFPPGNVQIDVKCFDGKVMLGGYAREFSQIQRAEELARQTPGVTSVETSVWVRSGS